MLRHTITAFRTLLIVVRELAYLYYSVGTMKLCQWRNVYKFKFVPPAQLDGTLSIVPSHKTVSRN